MCKMFCIKVDIFKCIMYQVGIDGYHYQNKPDISYNFLDKTIAFTINQLPSKLLLPLTV